MKAYSPWRVQYSTVYDIAGWVLFSRFSARAVLLKTRLLDYVSLGHALGIRLSSGKASKPVERRYLEEARDITFLNS